MSDLIQVNSVTKDFSNHRALDNVSINIPKQSIFGLLGPNGAGKTTLIRIINQIIAQDSGEILFDGKKINPKHVERIGYLPEERGLYKKMKVGEQALYLSQLKGVHYNDAKKLLKEWFEKFDLLPWWNNKVETLSKGMQQKVQFIITVLHNPELLIFDEPFSGFDPININLIKDEIIKLKNNGATIIFSTHNMSSVEELCDHIALINKSKKVLEGNIYKIKRSYANQVYQVEMSNLSGSLLNVNDNNFELLNQENKNGITEATIKIKTNANTNDLISKLFNNGTIVGFKEVVPSMDEIFIDTVSRKE